MPFVCDASVTLCWFFPGEQHPDAELALDRSAYEEIVVPPIWWFEVRNGMILGERRRRFGSEQTAFFLEKLSGRTIIELQRRDEARLLTLSRTHNLTVYDAAYLELAIAEALPLATLDQKLAAAARAEGVPLLAAA